MTESLYNGSQIKIMSYFVPKRCCWKNAWVAVVDSQRETMARQVGTSGSKREKGRPTKEDKSLPKLTLQNSKVAKTLSGKINITRSFTTNLPTDKKSSHQSPPMDPH